MIGFLVIFITDQKWKYFLIIFVQMWSASPQPSQVSSPGFVHLPPIHCANIGPLPPPNKLLLSLSLPHCSWYE